GNGVGRPDRLPRSGSRAACAHLHLSDARPTGRKGRLGYPISRARARAAAPCRGGSSRLLYSRPLRAVLRSEDSMTRFVGTDSYIATEDLKLAVNAAITLER